MKEKCAWFESACPPELGPAKGTTPPPREVSVFVYPITPQ